MKTSRFITEILPSAFLNKDFDLKNLRNDVKKRYLYYNKLDTDRFPIFEYNTNRKNYEPLKESFEEEFFTRRGISRTKNNLHIPSTNTLALFFTDDSYTPSQKILNTCRSYTKGNLLKIDTLNDNEMVSDVSQSKYSKGQLAVGRTFLILGAILFLAYVSYKLLEPKYERLRITRPTLHSIIPRIVAIEGTVEGASEIWIVVKSKSTNKYYVQQAILSQKNGDWVGRIIIGSVSNEDIGQAYEIKAFLNPVKKMKAGDELKAWPTAEISTETIEVIRGSKLSEE
jgi:hypothetical protein